MSTAEVIVWLADHLYLTGQARSKAAARSTATTVVRFLIDKGVLVVTDATPS